MALNTCCVKTSISTFLHHNVTALVWKLHLFEVCGSKAFSRSYKALIAVLQQQRIFHYMEYSGALEVSEPQIAHICDFQSC